MSFRVIDSSLSTWPRTERRNVFTSTSVGMTAQCQRTKNESFGGEYAAVEHLERRLEQRRPRALQDHGRLLREGRRDHARCGPLRQRQVVPHFSPPPIPPGRTSKKRQASRAPLRLDIPCPGCWP